MRVSAMLGHCIISPDPEIGVSKGGIYYPNQLRSLPKTGLVLLHSPTSSWDYENLTNKRVVFDRWGGKLFKIGDLQVYNLSQWYILAIFDEDFQTESSDDKRRAEDQDQRNH